jgi:hypothetical protein
MMWYGVAQRFQPSYSWKGGTVTIHCRRRMLEAAFGVQVLLYLRLGRVVWIR